MKITRFKLENFSPAPQEFDFVVILANFDLFWSILYSTEVIWVLGLKEIGKKIITLPTAKK